MLHLSCIFHVSSSSKQNILHTDICCDFTLLFVLQSKMCLFIQTIPSHHIVNQCLSACIVCCMHLMFQMEHLLTSILLTVSFTFSMFVYLYYTHSQSLINFSLSALSYANAIYIRNHTLSLILHHWPVFIAVFDPLYPNG